uniref:Uncharacterized protein n=1 Tax=viral metagenome TaxID=1070528 RepID=A0A6C0IGL4_9ZZZZ
MEKSDTLKEDDLVQMILRQTNYSEAEAKDKLKEFNNDAILVIKSYFGIAEKKVPEKIKSVNQEIYKQFRLKLDNSMKEYRDSKGGNL